MYFQSLFIVPSDGGTSKSSGTAGIVTSSMNNKGNNMNIASGHLVSSPSRNDPPGPAIDADSPMIRASSGYGSLRRHHQQQQQLNSRPDRSGSIGSNGPNGRSKYVLPYRRQQIDGDLGSPSDNGSDSVPSSDDDQRRVIGDRRSSGMGIGYNRGSGVRMGLYPSGRESGRL